MPDDDDVIHLPTGRPAPPVKAPEVTYDIGGYPDNVPLIGSFVVGGSLKLEKQLPIGAQCTVTIAGPDGEVVATAEGHVAAIPFIEHDEKDLFWVERQHKVKV